MYEQLISFETAKLAKEKGFKIPSRYYIWDTEEQDYTSISDSVMDSSTIGNPLAPTQSLLQKWIREEHRLDIIIRSETIGYGYLIYNRYPPKNITNNSIFQTYEQSLEAALLETLKLIEK